MGQAEDPSFGDWMWCPAWSADPAVTLEGSAGGKRDPAEQPRLCPSGGSAVRLEWEENNF